MVGALVALLVGSWPSGAADRKTEGNKMKDYKREDFEFFERGRWRVVIYPVRGYGITWAVTTHYGPQLMRGESLAHLSWWFVASGHNTTRGEAIRAAVRAAREKYARNCKGGR